MNIHRAKSLKLIHLPFSNTESQSKIETQHSDTDKLAQSPLDPSSSFILFDLMNKYCHTLTLQALLTPNQILSKKPCVLYIKVDNKETIEKLFETYKFNPLIQSECCEWSFKEKDYVMYFDNCFFIAISDCSINEDIENPIQIKILVYPDMIIVISFDTVHFIENVFKTEMQFMNFPSLIDPEEGLYLITGNRDDDQVRACKKTSIDDGTLIEIYLYRILDSIISRYEKILFALLIECQTCMSYSTEISYKERVEYLVRVSVSEKSLIYFSQLIKPKISIINSLKVLGKNKKQLKPYSKCLKDRIKKMTSLNLAGKKLLAQAKVLYRTCCEDKLMSASFSAGNLAKFFSVITAMFLPPFLMVGLWGTNLRIPAQMGEDLRVFFTMLGAVVVYFLLGVLYFKKIGWI